MPLEKMAVAMIEDAPPAQRAALRHVAPYDSTALGLQNPCRRGRFLLYMSDHEGHASVTRVADMMNLGRNAVRLVPSRRDLTIDPAALDRMIAEHARLDWPAPVCGVMSV